MRREGSNLGRRSPQQHLPPRAMELLRGCGDAEREAAGQRGRPVGWAGWGLRGGRVRTPLEATQGQMACFFSQLPYKCHQNRVAYVGY